MPVESEAISINAWTGTAGATGTLDVDAAWEDNQGIWYRRGGLVSFVDSSRVKAIAARKPAKATEVPNR